jgi:hypothetical protein
MPKQTDRYIKALRETGCPSEFPNVFFSDMMSYWKKMTPQEVLRDMKLSCDATAERTGYGWQWTTCCGGGDWNCQPTACQLLTDFPDDETDADKCAAQCTELQHSCNDPKIGSNQHISCAQACMIRARGTSVQDCVSIVNTQAATLGCQRTVNGFTYGFCGTCIDATEQNSHGVNGSQPGIDGCYV